ncbi:hypothetical protein C8R44DRAFT_883795 [Mycena epipterygia]|nr:hypothetical protein C8R44DRAFT_883795 [Mycena epipterygia]
MRLTAVGNVLHTVDINPFRDSEAGNVLPWSGSAAARFEPSTDAKHAGRRILHLRIVKIIQPVTSTVKGYTGKVIKPEEGRLLNRSTGIDASIATQTLT